ncbi:MAG: hypothetical protein LPK45_07190, partial [Bacteroidota bacterium]|nr:hypothetical protein [Bacteroidota bacterium]MDX5430861.1 hypothetical protein [Bacteroidota bacterium]MDX5469605.1 hypothetical protein [Bacteroidota bacterium]
LAFQSAVTNEDGHFELELDENSNALYLMVRKRGYLDTAYFIPKDAFQSVELALHPILFADTTPRMLDTAQVAVVLDTNSQAYRDWKKELKQDFKEIEGFINEKLKFNSRNINDTFFRKFQFSVVPGLSTNRMLSGNVVNDYSLNLLGGYSKGVNRLELGGVFNLDEGDVKYVQGAGVFNVVVGSVTGFQGAGVFNVTEGNVTGFQGAGVFNVNGASVKGFQGAGVFNVADGQIEGVQGAGVFNIANGKVHGAQAAGIFNISTDEVQGFQGAGIYNISDGKLKGVQAAGIWNYAQHIQGLQAAGIFNSAEVVQGAQVGLINIADSMNGVPIGLFSFVKKGYHKLDIGADEVFLGRLAFRSGTHWFHNIIQVGVDQKNFGSRDPLWMVGYGVGTSLPIRKHFIDFDITASQISKGAPAFYLSHLGQLYLGVDLRLSKRISLAGGITANSFVVDVDHPDFGETFNPLYSKASTRTLDYPFVQQNWLGWRATIRFF